MAEFRVVWQPCPHVQHPNRRALFVEAPDQETARAVAKDHIERTTGYTWFTVWECEPYTRPAGGRVLEG